MSNSGSNINKWRQPSSSTMDPSKAWIRNMGPGTTNRLPKTHNNHRNIPVQYVKQPPKPANKSQSPPHTFKAKESSNTRELIDEAMIDLQNIHISNGLSKLLKKNDDRNKQSITMTYSQLMDTIQTMMKSAKETDKLEVTDGTSKKCLQPVYMDDEDVNDLMQSGHIKINNGKLLYKKPKSID